MLTKPSPWFNQQQMLPSCLQVPLSQPSASTASTPPAPSQPPPLPPPFGGRIRRRGRAVALDGRGRRRRRGRGSAVAAIRRRHRQARRSCRQARCSRCHPCRRCRLARRRVCPRHGVSQGRPTIKHYGDLRSAQRARDLLHQYGQRPTRRDCRSQTTRPKGNGCRGCHIK